jgi:hypothetical protein
MPRVPASLAAIIMLIGALLLYWGMLGLGLLQVKPDDE